jgi:hypothetical protein
MADNEERLGRDWEKRGIPQIPVDSSKESAVEDEGDGSM